ncbi:hypothetical protein KCU78_g950, partial [Aureobasidium melanogenum]
MPTFTFLARKGSLKVDHFERRYDRVLAILMLSRDRTPTNKRRCLRVKKAKKPNIIQTRIVPGISHGILVGYKMAKRNAGTGSVCHPSYGSLSRQAEKRPANLEEKLENAEDTTKDAVGTQNALEQRLKASDSDFSRDQNELTPKKTARNAGWISGYIFSGLLEVSTSIRLVRRASATRTASNKRSIPTHSRSQQHLQNMFSGAFTQKTGKGKKNDELSYNLRDQLSEIIYISSHAVALPIKNGPLRAVRLIPAEVLSQHLVSILGLGRGNGIFTVLHAIEEFEISCSYDEHMTDLVEVRGGCYEAGDT